MGLSYHWRTILTKLAEYGLDGVDREAFCELMSGEPYSHNNMTREALSQMFTQGCGYYEALPYRNGHRDFIRITTRGRDALSE